MGRLHITNEGVRMDGNADFLAALKAKTIRSRNDAPLEVISGSNLSLTAMDGTGKVGGQISMNSRQVIFKNKQLNIQNMKVTFLITYYGNSGIRVISQKKILGFREQSLFPEFNWNTGRQGMFSQPTTEWSEPR